MEGSQANRAERGGPSERKEDGGAGRLREGAAHTQRRQQLFGWSEGCIESEQRRERPALWPEDLYPKGAGLTSKNRQPSKERDPCASEAGTWLSSRLSY